MDQETENIDGKLAERLAAGMDILKDQDKTAEFTPEQRIWVPPWRDGDDQSLQTIIDGMPGNPDADIDIMVKLIENPESPYALTGACDLMTHDCIHMVLGRGLLNQDEAFVIGYTMGTAGDALSADEVTVFKFITKRVYRGSYRFNEDDLRAFDLGLMYGKRHPIKIYEFDFMAHREKSIASLRDMLDINPDELVAIYKEERHRIPGTFVSNRLPIT